jgi:hypothetical protein
MLLLRQRGCGNRDKRFWDWLTAPISDVWATAHHRGNTISLLLGQSIGYGS